MKDKIKIINVDSKNLATYGFACVKNSKHPGYEAKSKWLKKGFSEGLKLKLLYSEKDGIVYGFIECVPGEKAWRSVSAPGYMFIHCIWVYPSKMQGKGHASAMVKKCIEDARKLKKKGVAVVASEGPWIAGRDLFLKLGFVRADKRDRFELLVKKFKPAPDPKFRRVEAKKYKGLNLLYSDQCPMAIKFLEDIKKFCQEKKIKLKIIKLKTAREAQNNPCVYGSFAIIYNGKIMADNPISVARFRNIVKKELKK